MSKYFLLPQSESMDFRKYACNADCPGSCFHPSHCSQIEKCIRSSVRKFIDAARHFRSCDQMKKLAETNFFSKAEIREGLKRYIHLKHIECV